MTRSAASGTCTPLCGRVTRAGACSAGPGDAVWSVVLMTGDLLWDVADFWEARGGRLPSTRPGVVLAGGVQPAGVYRTVVVSS
ncbi:hypothetical protein GCM10007977_110130 [Dactylosporangium sucinum]|uniref:Uncharacterized protein n=1 Tax=Dactylosporangium sucinum TaxID=1424081 RepID=A0A917UFW9_9ACTN|nr:hypothetical protein GCM10007977_110130 [Dactylosporangium sucinum]